MDEIPKFKPDILNLIKEKVANSLELISTGKDVQNKTLLVQSLKINSKWNLMKQRSFCMETTLSFGHIAYEMGKHL